MPSSPRANGGQQTDTQQDQAAGRRVSRVAWESLRAGPTLGSQRKPEGSEGIFTSVDSIERDSAKG